MSRSVMYSMEQWIAKGWLSPLDKAFAGFLRDQDPDADDTVLWAGALVSHQLSRGEVYLDLHRLCAQPGLTLAIPGDEAWQTADEQTIEDWPAFKSHTLADWLAPLAQSPLVATGAGTTPLVLHGQRVYLRRYWHYQQTLDDQIGLRLQPIRTQLPVSLQSALEALFSHSLEQPDWQKIACVLALRARFSIITGGPGTGKTTTLTKLLSLLLQLAAAEGKGTLNIVLAAPTGKAAARVSESIANALEHLQLADSIKRQIPKKAATLHRLLGSRPDSRRFRHHRHNPLLADIVIVDEASMIDLEMMASLLDALPATAQLILLGDKDQLASVEAGAVLGDLCRSADRAAYDPASRNWIAQYAGTILPADSEGTAINQQTVMLRHSHRFGAHSGIGQLARAVNAGDAAKAQDILAATDTYPDLNRILLSGTHDARLQQLVTAWSADVPGYGHYLHIMQQRPTQSEAFDAWAHTVLQAFDRFRVLSALRRGDWGVEGLNRRIEQWLLPGKKPGLWYAGRPVMITRNDYTLGLMNGDIGIALQDNEGKLRVAFPGEETSSHGKIRWVSPMRLPDVETAFAMTVHKSQGSEFNHVAMLLPEVRSPVLTRELIYTGITRAKAKFTLLESRADVFAQAIQASCR